MLDSVSRPDDVRDGRSCEPDRVQKLMPAVVDDVKNYQQPLAETLQQHGYPPDDAAAAALTLLPDILHYNRTRQAHYPNSRLLTDDVFSAPAA